MTPSKNKQNTSLDRKVEVLYKNIPQQVHPWQISSADERKGIFYHKALERMKRTIIIIYKPTSTKWGSREQNFNPMLLTSILCY